MQDSDALDLVAVLKLELERLRMGHGLDSTADVPVFGKLSRSRKRVSVAVDGPTPESFFESIVAADVIVQHHASVP